MQFKLLASATLVAATFSTQAAAAEFYIVQDSSTKHCTIVDKKPTVKTETIVGENGKVYTTREEANTAMTREKICETH
jgi:exosome complex RNA-binding protein Rrp4